MDDDVSDVLDNCDALESLLVAVRVAVVKLESIAVEGERALDVERWGVASRCSREVALVFEALGVAPTSGRRRLAKGDADPFAALCRAYATALASPLPRAVRALLSEHQAMLLGAAGTSLASAA